MTKFLFAQTSRFLGKIIFFSLFFRFMRQMTTEKLFDEGKYMVIYLQPETVKMEERQFFLWTLEEMAKVKVSGVEGVSEDI